MSARIVHFGGGGRNTPKRSVGHSRPQIAARARSAVRTAKLTIAISLRYLYLWKFSLYRGDDCGVLRLS
jgi:hypothetical protein